MFPCKSTIMNKNKMHTSLHMQPTYKIMQVKLKTIGAFSFMLKNKTKTKALKSMQQQFLKPQQANGQPKAFLKASASNKVRQSGTQE